MNTAAYIELGIIQRRQGLKGEVVASLSQDFPHSDTLKTLFIQTGHTLVPYGIERLSRKHHRAIIKLQGVDDPKVAHDLKGRAIFVPQEALPQPPPQEGHLARLVGYQVVDGQEGSLGLVQAIYTPSQQSLLAIDHQGQELLLPYHEDIVTHVDHAQQNIDVQLPKGFIEALCIDKEVL